MADIYNNNNNNNEDLDADPDDYFKDFPDSFEMELVEIDNPNELGKGLCANWWQFTDVKNILQRVMRTKGRTDEARDEEFEDIKKQLILPPRLFYLRTSQCKDTVPDFENWLSKEPEALNIQGQKDFKVFLADARTRNHVHTKNGKGQHGSRKEDDATAVTIIYSLWTRRVDIYPAYNNYQRIPTLTTQLCILAAVGKNYFPNSGGQKHAEAISTIKLLKHIHNPSNCVLGYQDNMSLLRLSGLIFVIDKNDSDFMPCASCQSVIPKAFKWCINRTDKVLWGGGEMHELAEK
jgi:hypothetical protein